MQSIGAFEAKTHFSALLEQVEKGQEMLITKHGRVVAKLSPVGFNKSHLKEAVKDIEKFQNDHQLTLGLDWKTLRDEGRK
jgi:prevent-host-death family protein